MKNKKFLFLLIALLLAVNLTYFLFLYPKDIQNNDSNKNLISNINEPVYVALYVGDIDGEVSEDWFKFYEQLTQFYVDNKIPVVFSFYPASIQNDKTFNEIFLKMYKTSNIELMQKGFRGDEIEMEMEELSLEDQRSIIKDGQDHYRDKMIGLTGSNAVKMPVLYNQIGSRVNSDTIKALEDLGFIFYFDVYVADDLESVTSTPKVDVTQYGVSFTKTREAGREQEFTTAQNIFNELNNFSREDLDVIKINGKKFIPLWAHQQDFESEIIENEIDNKKWEMYTKTVEALNKDSNVILISPVDAYNLRH